MPKRICSVEGCENLYYGRGYCNKHWQAAKRRGELAYSRSDKRDTVANICGFPDCSLPRHGSGYCSGHYWQFKNGRPMAPLTRRALTPAQRFWQKVEKTPTCWNWTGSTHHRGYGTIWDGATRKWVKAHRFAYELLIGPIPSGKVIDHICFNTGCVNPEHLRPVTVKQNQEHLGGAYRTSKTGVRGVSWSKSAKAILLRSVILAKT